MEQQTQRIFCWQVILLAVCLMASAWNVQAEVTDISANPMSTASGTVVRPNVMFVLDDSGSMDFNFMPDFLGYGNLTGGKCRRANDDGRMSAVCQGTETDGDNKPTVGGDPPIYSPFVNAIYYNPAISYTPPVSPCDVSQTLPTMNSVNTNGWKAVRVVGHAIDNNTCVQSSTTANILTQYPERIYCGTVYNSKTKKDETVCKQNGLDKPNGSTRGYDWPDSTYNSGKTQNSNPHYFLIKPKEYCSTSQLEACELRSAPTATHSYPAYVRYCSSVTDAGSGDVVSGGGKCQDKHTSTYRYARYGDFVRVDIQSGNTFAKYPDREDCVGASCSYAEEMTNFANWYAYYRTRLFTMKSAAGWHLQLSIIVIGLDLSLSIQSHQ